jgi:hypothetical protein
MTCSNTGLSDKGSNTLPGSLVELILACIIAIFFNTLLFKKLNNYNIFQKMQGS